MNLTNTKPIPKIRFRDFLCAFLLLLVVSLLVSKAVADSRSRTVQEYLEENYDSIYEAAYLDGYSDGYDEGYVNGIEYSKEYNKEIYSNTYCVGICDNCQSEYDPYNDWNYGFGLCYDCGRELLSSCVFCDARTFEWGDSWYAICPDCMGEMVESTNIEEFFEAFNESR